MTNVDSTGGTPPELIEENNWIEFKITDKETGDPIKGVTVRIKDSKGVPREKKTSAEGMVRFETINKDACELTGLFYNDRKVMETKEEYTLKDGDTLKQIAENECDPEITWEDIAVYNWGHLSRDKKIANESMRDDFNCTYYTEGHMIYKESGDSKDD